jgi:hypothetical protein
MATSNLPGTDAARHGTGDADLTIMLAAHAAFRRDLVRLAHPALAITFLTGVLPKQPGACQRRADSHSTRLH